MEKLLAAGQIVEEKQREQIAANVKLLAEKDASIAALTQERDRYKAGLERTTKDGCGCHPVCQCDSETNLRIWKEEVQTLAKEALNPPEVK